LVFGLLRLHLGHSLQRLLDPLYSFLGVPQSRCELGLAGFFFVAGRWLGFAGLALWCWASLAGCRWLCRILFFGRNTLLGKRFWRGDCLNDLDAGLRWLSNGGLALAGCFCSTIGSAGSGELLFETLQFGLGFCKQSFQGNATAKGGSTSAGAGAHAILGNPVEIHQALTAQHLNGLLEQILKEVKIGNAEIGEGVVVDEDTTSDPLESIVVAAQPGQGASAGDTEQDGIQPQRDKDTRVNGRSAWSILAGANAVIQDRKVKSLNIPPNSAGWVVWFYQLVYRFGVHHLLAVRCPHSRLARI
jgi:hypothetical protein